MTKCEQLKHIVIIDDNKNEYLLAQEVFNECLPHVEVTWFANGNQFLDFFKNISIISGSIVVLMDVNMPGKNARKILGEMQENSLIGQVPILVISSVEKPGDEEFFSRFPQVSFHQKPCSLEEYYHFIDLMENSLSPAV